MIVVNTETIPGMRIVALKGMVQGNTIRAKHIGRDLMAGLKNIVGGELKGYTELLTESRKQAMERMLAQAEALVDGQPQVRRMHHEVPEARLGRLRAELHHRLLGPPLRVARQVTREHVLPTQRRRLDDRPARLKIAAIARYRRDVQAGVHANIALVDKRSVRGRGQTAFLHRLDPPGHELHALHPHRRAARREQQLGLLFDRDALGIDLVRRRPVRVRIGLHRRQLDRARHHAVVGRGGFGGLFGDRGDVLAVHLAGRGKAPRSAHQRAHTDAVGLRAARFDQLFFARAHALQPVPRNPHVRVVRARRHHLVERVENQIALLRVGGGVRRGDWRRRATRQDPRRSRGGSRKFQETPAIKPGIRRRRRRDGRVWDVDWPWQHVRTLSTAPNAFKRSRDPGIVPCGGNPVLCAAVG